MKKRIIIKNICAVWVMAVFILGSAAGAFADQSIPKKKQTVLNLYITAQQAFAKWQSDPEHIKILDVRTPGEYIFVGHAPMAVNIPLRFLNNTVNSITLGLDMPANEKFVEQVKEKFNETDTIFVMCRSGSRSAAAVNLMAKAGFKTVFNIIDGFEGDSLKVPGSYNNGKRLVNGWKNSGAPWTYKLERGQAYVK